MHRRQMLGLTGLLLGVVLLPFGAAVAQTAKVDWPSKPLRLVVGFPGGSSPDLTARALAEPLSKALGQPVVVDNRPGASGNIAADIVAKASDGHTLGLMINGNLTIARLLNAKLPYDPLKDLQAISLIGTAPLVLVTTPGAVGSPQEFVPTGKKAGTTWSYGTPGQGTVAHLGMELLKSKAGLSPVHVPYPGNPQVVNALLSDQIHLALLPPGLALPQVRAGKLRAIGITSAGRSALVPDLPALAELGIAGVDLEVWNALAAPASLPKPVVARLAAAVSDIVRSPEMRQRLFAQGWQVVGSSPEGLRNRIQQDTQALGAVIAQQGIKNE